MSSKVEMAVPSKSRNVRLGSSQSSWALSRRQRLAAEAALSESPSSWKLRGAPPRCKYRWFLIRYNRSGTNRPRHSLYPPGPTSKSTSKRKSGFERRTSLLAGQFSGAAERGRRASSFATAIRFVDETWFKHDPPRSPLPRNLERHLADRQRQMIEAALRVSKGRVAGRWGRGEARDSQADLGFQDFGSRNRQVQFKT